MAGNASTAATFGRFIGKIFATILILFLVYIGFILAPLVIAIFEAAESVILNSHPVQAAPDRSASAVDSFNNAGVMIYIVPLFGIWLLAAIGRWRKRLPASILGTFICLSLAIWLSWHIGEALVGVYDSLSAEGMMSDRLRRRSWKLGLLFALAVPVLAFRWLRRGPGWLDRIIRGEARLDSLIPGAGEVIGAESERARLWLFACGIVFTPILWIVFDVFDGGGTPGPFALTVRGLFVVWALWLIFREQVALAWPGGDPEMEHAGLKTNANSSHSIRSSGTNAETSERQPSGFGKREPSGMPRHPGPDDDGVSRIIPKGFWSGPHGDFLREIGASPDDLSNIIPTQESIQARFDELKRQQEAFVANLNAQMPKSVTLIPWAMIPWSVWNGPHSGFLLATCELYPVGSWNMMLLPDDEAGAIVLDLPKHRGGVPPELERMANSVIGEIRGKFSQVHARIGAALEKGELSALDEYKKPLDEAIAFVRGLAQYLGAHTYGEDAYNRHKALFANALGSAQASNAGIWPES